MNKLFDSWFLYAIKVNKLWHALHFNYCWSQINHCCNQDYPSKTNILVKIKRNDHLIISRLPKHARDL